MHKHIYIYTYVRYKPGRTILCMKWLVLLSFYFSGGLNQEGQRFCDHGDLEISSKGRISFGLSG